MALKSFHTWVQESTGPVFTPEKDTEKQGPDAGKESTRFTMRTPDGTPIPDVDARQVARLKGKQRRPT